jgi:adenosylmethionine-8-amino-7-oxononanoate aminotransferase
VADRETKMPYSEEARFSDRVFARCMEMGILLYPGHGSVAGGRGDHLMIAPPYIVTEGQIDLILETLRQAIQQISAET